MHKRQKPGMYKRHKPCMYKRLFALAKQSDKLVSIEHIPCQLAQTFSHQQHSGIFDFWSLPKNIVKSRTKEGKSSTANKNKHIKSTWFRPDTAGQFLQTVVLQVETAEATKIPKKTLWECSQFVALQVKCF